MGFPSNPRINKKHKAAQLWHGLAAVAPFLIVWMLPDAAHAIGIRGRFTDPDIEATYVNECPQEAAPPGRTAGCSFEVRIRDIHADALKCADDTAAFVPGCTDPSSYNDIDITKTKYARQQDCNGGFCKLVFEDVFTLRGLADTIEGLAPKGLNVPNYTDATSTTCPALVVRRMTADIIGFACKYGVNTKTNKCYTGPPGTRFIDDYRYPYLNATGTFPTMFTGAFAAELCIHGDFYTSGNVVVCSSTGGTCESTFPLPDTTEGNSCP
jgi:hypothetical protein